ncbi:MAG TPA: LytR C-terminal domain-containing protein [Sphingomicrobium sp.]|nr:LytR C-terminal domain-containing protein [Sphingomicrobium sp.]
MRNGGKALAIGASFAIVGCATAGSNLQVRTVDPAAKLHQGNDVLAAAQGLLALGSVGLALEGFRDAQRRQPSDPRPLAGIAACYTSMGRYDLAEQNYQAALALSPEDPSLLRSLADIFAAEGKTTEALEARMEAAKSVSAVAALATQPAPAAALAIQKPSASVTVELPPVRPAERLASDAPVPVVTIAPEQTLAATSSSITVPLPPAEPQLSAPAAVQLAARSLRVDQPIAPRLVRVSPGEVALVTTAKPIWRAQLVARTQTSTTVQWVPLQMASAHPNIQILNAARREGMAARARSILLDRGWRRIAIGDAPTVREKSVVLYPASRSMLGKSLAAQFGFRSVMSPGADVLRILLGRDAALKKAPSEG